MLRSAFVIGLGVLFVEFATATAQPVRSVAPDAKDSTPPIEIVPPTRHTQDVNSLVFSSDDENRLVASSGDDGVIKLWDVKTGRLIRNIVRIDPNNKFWRVKALSRDGRRLLAYVGGDFKVWDTITGKEIVSISDSPDRDAVVMSQDGTRIAALRADKTLKLFDAYTGKERSALKNVVAFALSPDGRRIVSVSADKAMELWDVESGKRNGEAKTLNEAVESVRFSPDGRRIAFKSASGPLTLREPESSRSVTELAGSKDSDFVFSFDGRFWAAQDGRGEVKIFSADTGAAHSAFKQPAEKSAIRAFSHDNNLLFFTPNDSPEAQKAGWVLRSVSSATGRTVNVVDGSPNEASDFGARFYVEGDGATLRLRDLDSWREVRTFAGQPALNAGAFSPTGARIAVALPENIAVLDAETGLRLGGCPSSSEPVSTFAFSSDERKLLYGGGRSIALCDIETGKIARSYTGHDAAVKSVSLSPDSNQLASGTDDGTVKLWEVASGKVLRTFKGNDRPANIVAFSPDGRKLLAGTDDNKVRIWDIASGRETRTLRMLVGPVTAMAVSPDGRRVAAGPYSSLMVKQWDIETGKELRRLETDYGGRFWTVTDVKYSNAGDGVLAATSNNFIVVWDINSGRKKADISFRDQDLKSIAFASDRRRLVSLDEAGVIRHWDRNSGAPLLTIIAFEDGEWLRVTPEGFFDSSSNEGKYLTVVRGLEVSSIDHLFDQLHRPDLVREKLAGDPHGKVRDAAARLDLTIR